MVALFGLPGSRNFTYKLVASRKGGREWLDSYLQQLGEDQETLGAHRQSEVVSDKDASRMKYRSGSRVVPEVGYQSVNGMGMNFSYSNVDVAGL